MGNLLEKCSSFRPDNVPCFSCRTVSAGMFSVRLSFRRVTCTEQMNHETSFFFSKTQNHNKGLGQLCAFQQVRGRQDSCLRTQAVSDGLKSSTV